MIPPAQSKAARTCPPAARRGVRDWILWFVLGLACVTQAEAHVWNMTRVRIAFADTRNCTVHLELDLTRALGSAEEYYELSRADATTQSRRIAEVFQAFWPRFHFRAGEMPLQGELTGFRLPAGERREFGYVGIGKMTRLEVVVKLPDLAGPVWFSPDNEVAIEYPLAVTFEIPAQSLNVTRWLDTAGPSRRFEYAANFAVVPTTGETQRASAESKLDLSDGEASAMTVLLTCWRYLHLGFRHIFPTGADHMLFVIGLFFLGISWRKLLTQTTVFTIAHTTTLALSALGIFSLPAWFVEPAIAGSIAFVAIENIVRPRLTSSRLVIVFMFGLIHGLGFAGSLAEVGLPKREFWVALLSFNFGVDFGQLFILAVCFLVFGWFRDRTWFRPRLVVPVCSLVALIGLIWAAQRIFHYAVPT
jgi:hydrogenase/urease accessory protein HupE